MRNYILIYFGLAHLHLDAPPIDVDSEIWRGTSESFDTRYQEIKAENEALGYTVTLKYKIKTFWELNHDNFAKLIEDASQHQNFIGYLGNEDSFVVTDSPRKREKRRFKLVPIGK